MFFFFVLFKQKTAYEIYQFFFFKQKTAYEIYQCDWSSDVCSSDLFMQMAYALQLPDFQPQVVELTGKNTDSSALSTLKAKQPSLVYTVGSYATKQVRLAMPQVWIVYAMVYYPEVEGFKNDPKMVGIAAFGSSTMLRTAVKAFRRRAKSLVVVHSSVTTPTVIALLRGLNSAGFHAEERSVTDPTKLPALFKSLVGQFDAVLILPDPLTADSDALRFLISNCIENRIMLVSLTNSLAFRGALCASFLASAAIGNQAAKVAKYILLNNKAPAAAMDTPGASALAVNKKTAKAMRLKVPSSLSVSITYE